MVLNRMYKIIEPFFQRYQKLLLILMAVCALPFISAAQTELNQGAVSNGAGTVSGGNYTSYVSAGQMATYMYANGTSIATQGIILNEISADVEFTFELSGNLNVNPEQNVGQLVMKSAAIELAGTPLEGATVYLILASDSTVFASTQTDTNGFYQFTKVPYKDFFFTVNTPEVPENPVVLELEQSTVFVKEVEIFGEVGTDGIEANVALTPQLTTAGDQQEYATWYLDADKDGFGDPKFTVKLNLNAQQTGYVENNLDCDDQDAGINPEIVDVPGSGLDLNCDGLFVWYVDADQDGYGGDIQATSVFDYPTVGLSENNMDCDDTNPLINPDGVDDSENGIDGNCDGIIQVCEEITDVVILAPADPVMLGTGIPISVTYSGDTPYSASFDWGDENTSNGNISAGLITNEHLYDSTGVYVLKLTLTDNCSTMSVHQFKYVVIYDPEGGFVTGSGVIYSPPGASTAYPDSTGYASFGFVSKYDKKSNVPKGNTEFEFDAGDLNFVSNEYDWLVVSGAKAKFKGRGEINGEPGFQFMISVIDGDIKQKGDPDIFRIKIWNELTQEIIYDNEMGVSINDDPTTHISSGSIVVHVPKTNSKAADISVSGENPDQLDDILVKAYPNPTSGKIMLDIASGGTDKIEVIVNNVAGQQILQNEFKATDRVELDLSGNTSGIYYIQTKIQDKIFTNKIILQRN